MPASKRHSEKLPKSQAPRSTQRAPKSCKECTRRKIKCDKIIPCRPCIFRGEAHLCSREVVIVNGSLQNLRSNDEIETEIQYSRALRTLECENVHLRKTVANLQTQLDSLSISNKHESSDSNHSSPSLSPTPLPSSLSNSHNNTEKVSHNDVNVYTYAVQYLLRGLIEFNEDPKNISSDSSVVKRTPPPSSSNHPFIPVSMPNIISPTGNKRAINPTDNNNDNNINNDNNNNNTNNNTNKAISRDPSALADSQFPRVVDYHPEMKKFIFTNNSSALPHSFFGKNSLKRELTVELNPYSEELNKIPSSLIFQMPEMTYDQSNALVHFVLDNTFFLNFAFSAESFYYEHKCFWESDIPKFLNFHFDRTRGEYLWSAIWYAILFVGVIYADTEFLVQLGFNPKSLQHLAKKYFSSAVECLNRGEFMRFPDIRSVQTCSLIGLGAYAIGEPLLYYSILNSVIVISQRLNLDKIDSEDCLQQKYSHFSPNFNSQLFDREYGRRLWWTIVICDWMETIGRTSVIYPGSFATVVPGNYNDDDLIGVEKIPNPKPLSEFTEVNYHIIMIKIAQIKRKYYFDSRLTETSVALEDLLQAAMELEAIQEKMPPILRADSSGNGGYDSKVLAFQRYLLSFSFAGERLYINRLMSVFINKEEWNNSCRSICLEDAHTILSMCVKDVPLYYKKNWLISMYCLTASVYVLLDILEDPAGDIKSRYSWVENVIPLMETLSGSNIIARRGIRIINRLMTLIINQAQEAQHGKLPLGSANNDLYEILRRVSTLPTINKYSKAENNKSHPKVKIEGDLQISDQKHEIQGQLHHQLQQQIQQQELQQQQQQQQQNLQQQELHQQELQQQELQQHHRNLQHQLQQQEAQHLPLSSPLIGDQPVNPNIGVQLNNQQFQPPMLNPLFYTLGAEEIDNIFNMGGFEFSSGYYT